MENSKIEWTHHTVNLWWGCQEVHAGCDNCYARVIDRRFKGNHWGARAPRRIVSSAWDDLARYQKKAAAVGEMHRVFIGSMMDIFEKPMPLVEMHGNEILGQDTGGLCQLLFQQISAGMYPNLLFLFLTKRPGNILKYIPEDWKAIPPTNVMYGTSVVNQETADRMIPELLEVPGRHFLSCEPLIGPVDLSPWIGPINIDSLASECGYFDASSSVNNGYGCTHPEQEERENGCGKCFDFSCPIASRLEPSEPLDQPIYKAFGFYGDELLMRYNNGIDWVIAGGESGPHARPMHPDWVRSLRDQCVSARVPFFFKQWGEWAPGASDFFYTEERPLWFLEPNGELSWFAGDTETTINHSVNYTGTSHAIEKIGKKKAGRLLDGREWNEVPAIEGPKSSV
jgi:protein gp37